MHKILLLKPLGLEKKKPDLGYAGAKARMLYQPDRSKASDPKRLLTQLSDLLQTKAQIAAFEGGNKRKTIPTNSYSYRKTIQAFPPSIFILLGQERKYMTISIQAGGEDMCADTQEFT